MNATLDRIGDCVTLALLWEATATKPGNVHRGADFADMTFADFATVAAAIGPVFDSPIASGSIGKLVISATKAMQKAVPVNTHLGTILLIAPLALATRHSQKLPGQELSASVRLIGDSTTVADAELVYQAIRLTSPGGLGEVAEADVNDSPEITLLEAMRLAAERDLVARQYTASFEQVFALADKIQTSLADGLAMNDAIVRAHVWSMSRDPDSLIARKCGNEVARESSDRAAALLAAGEPGSEAYLSALADFDFWLRSDGHRRNPGTTADLIGAALFVLLVEDRVEWPVRFYGNE